MKRSVSMAGLPLMMWAVTTMPALAGQPYLPAGCPYVSQIPTWGILTNKGIDCFVGTDPRFSGVTTTIVSPVVPLILHFMNADGSIAGTSDPTAPSYSNPRLSPFGGVLGSPAFQSQEFKFGSTDVGSVQWIEATERASFWNLPNANFKDWHVVMVPLPFPATTVDVPFGSWSGGTNHVYTVNQTFLDSAILAAVSGFSSSNVPIVLTYNINGSNGDGGYHDKRLVAPDLYAFYLWASWYDGWDIQTLSHEIAEFAHDPFGNSPVAPFPLHGSFKLPWNPPYEFTKCQINLEVGDPVEDRSGSALQLAVTNSVMTYTFQNVATAAWLMQASPSFSVNGWYTLKGAVDGEFAAPAPACAMN
jgi:hypothetical protein